jgi:hypothetical protein
MEWEKASAGRGANAIPPSGRWRFSWGELSGTRMIRPTLRTKNQLEKAHRAPMDDRSIFHG